MSLSWGSPLIFAHRGASAHAPENTLAAFELAIQQNADVIELDTKLSADGHVVVIHDQSVDRTTNGSGRVSELTLVSLRELDAGWHFSDTFRGEQIPTLEEVLEIYAGRTFLNIELTNYRTPFDALPMKIAQLMNFATRKHKYWYLPFIPYLCDDFITCCHQSRLDSWQSVALQV